MLILRASLLQVADSIIFLWGIALLSRVNHACSLSCSRNRTKRLLPQSALCTNSKVTNVICLFLDTVVAQSESKFLAFLLIQLSRRMKVQNLNVAKSCQEVIGCFADLSVLDKQLSNYSFLREYSFLCR